MTEFLLSALKGEGREGKEGKGREGKVFDRHS